MFKDWIFLKHSSISLIREPALIHPTVCVQSTYTRLISKAFPDPFINVLKNTGCQAKVNSAFSTEIRNCVGKGKLHLPAHLSPALCSPLIQVSTSALS